MAVNDWTHEFLLNPDITFLNFGSFGACPKEVFADYQEWQRKLEWEPVQFITKQGVDALQLARKALADYLHCDQEGLVFVPNPTHAINILAKSLRFEAGDEILSTDLEYGAMDRTWNFYCEHYKTEFIRQHIPLPIHSEDDFVQAFWAGLTHRTKAIFISHITSATGLRLPVERICAEARKRGLIIIVDGAHVPGHIPFRLDQLDVDFYTGACHKWMMTPKGSSFLYASPAFRDQLEPLIVSWGYKSAVPSGSIYFDYHQFNGTRDFSAYLTIPAAIAFMKKHDWAKRAAECHQLAIKKIPEFNDLLQTEALAPMNAQFYGQMCSIPIKTASAPALQKVLYDRFRIEIPVFDYGQGQYIRYSVQVFNGEEDLDKLYAALKLLISENQITVP